MIQYEGSLNYSFIDLNWSHTFCTMHEKTCRILKPQLAIPLSGTDSAYTEVARGDRTKSLYGRILHKFYIETKGTESFPENEFAVGGNSY